MTTYTIKPLEWRKTDRGANAYCVLGDFEVYKSEQALVQV